MRSDAHSPQVQPVGVPASLDGDVGMTPFVSVTGTGTVQQSEFVIRQYEHSATQFCGELGTKWSMIKMRANVRLIRWTLPIVGVGAIPLVIQPIDDFCEETLMPPVSRLIDGFFKDQKDGKEMKE